MRTVAAFCLMLTVLIAALPERATAADKIKTAEAACTQLKKHANLIADQRIAGPAREWWCEFYMHGPYFVVSIRGVCYEPEGCGSTLIGWFGVRKSDGSISEWDVNEDRPVKRLTPR